MLSLGGLLAKILGAFVPYSPHQQSLAVTEWACTSGFPPYILFLTVAQAGVPQPFPNLLPKTTKSETFSRGERCFRFAMLLWDCWGRCAPWQWLRFPTSLHGRKAMPKRQKAFLIVAPALVFVPVTNVLKAYFRATWNMVPSGCNHRCGTGGETVCRFAVRAQIYARRQQSGDGCGACNHRQRIFFPCNNERCVFGTQEEKIPSICL